MSAEHFPTFNQLTNVTPTKNGDHQQVLHPSTFLQHLSFSLAIFFARIFVALVVVDLITTFFYNLMLVDAK